MYDPEHLSFPIPHPLEPDAGHGELDGEILHFCLESLKKGMGKSHSGAALNLGHLGVCPSIK